MRAPHWKITNWMFLSPSWAQRIFQIESSHSCCLPGSVVFTYTCAAWDSARASVGLLSRLPEFFLWGAPPFLESCPTISSCLSLSELLSLLDSESLPSSERPTPFPVLRLGNCFQPVSPAFWDHRSSTACCPGWKKKKRNFIYCVQFSSCLWVTETGMQMPLVTTPTWKEAKVLPLLILKQSKWKSYKKPTSKNKNSNC